MNALPSPRVVNDAIDLIGPDREHALTHGAPLSEVPAHVLRAIVDEANALLT